MLMVSLKPPKPGKLKRRNKNAILSVISTTCSSEDGRLQAGSSRLCRLQGLGLGQCLLAHMLVFPWQNICVNIWLSFVFSAEEYTIVITEMLYSSHVQEIPNLITAWTFLENGRFLPEGVSWYLGFLSIKKNKTVVAVFAKLEGNNFPMLQAPFQDLSQPLKCVI